VRGAGREEFGAIVRNERNQLNRLGVRIVFGTAVTPDFVLAEEHDAVIVATGSVPKELGIPGGDRPNVFNVWQVLKGEASIGENVFFIDDDGGHQATSTIEYLADLGKKVHVATTAFYVGGELGPTQDITLSKQRFAQKGVTVTADFYVLEIKESEIVGINVYSNQPQVFTGYDTVVAAMGNRVDDQLYFALKGKVKELYRVGDCVAPRRVDMAIHEGYWAGRRV